jgi:hypothetical protein
MLVVETGDGLPNADAYADVAFVTEWAMKGSSFLVTSVDTLQESWEAVETPLQERLIRLATNWIDSRFGAAFLGRRQSASQSLQWPRVNIDVLSIEPVPNGVKWAMAETALGLHQGVELFGVKDQSAAGIEALKAGPVEIRYTPGTWERPVILSVIDFLRVYLANPNRVVRT